MCAVSGKGRELSVEGGEMASISDSEPIWCISNAAGSRRSILLAFVGVPTGVGPGEFGRAEAAKV